MSLRPFLQLRRLQAAAGLVEAFPAGPQGLLDGCWLEGPGAPQKRGVWWEVGEPQLWL